MILFLVIFCIWIAIALDPVRNNLVVSEVGLRSWSLLCQFDFDLAWICLGKSPTLEHVSTQKPTAVVEIASSIVELCHFSLVELCHFSLVHACAVLIVSRGPIHRSRP